MAHFAELDENNVVLRVCVVDNSHVPSDKHADGETWCQNFWGGTWKQTSYNDNFRKQYAGVGFTCDATKDEFVAPRPFDSWTLDSSNNWQPPVAEPDPNPDSDGKYYVWNETTYQGYNSKGWIKIE